MGKLSQVQAAVCCMPCSLGGLSPLCLRARVFGHLSEQQSASTPSSLSLQLALPFCCHLFTHPMPGIGDDAFIHNWRPWDDVVWCNFFTTRESAPPPPEVVARFTDNPKNTDQARHRLETLFGAMVVRLGQRVKGRLFPLRIQVVGNGQASPHAST